MVPIIDNPAVLALYRPEKPGANEHPAEPAPQYVRAPEGNGHEAAVKQQGGAR